LYFLLETTIAQTLSPTIIEHSGVNYERLAQIDNIGLLKAELDILTIG
jgi:hypothetical protein